MGRTRGGWAGVGLAGLLVLAACGGDEEATESTSPGGATTSVAGGQSAETGSTPDPCSLVTVEEVSAALGSPLEPPEGSVLTPPIGGRTCLFSNTDFPPIKTFQITVRTNADFAKQLRDQGQTVDRLFDDTKKLYTGDGTAVEDVAGLGDRAYKSVNGYFILKNGVSIDTSIGFNADPSPQAKAALQSLTEKAVSRL